MLTHLDTKYMKADTDGETYRVEDLDWVIEPYGDDPGVLGPKPSVHSVLYDVAAELGDYIGD